MQLLKNICARGRRIAPGSRQGLEQSAEYLSPLVERWNENAKRKIQKLIPAILAILPRELRHRLCIFDTLERRALLAAQEALSTAIDAHDDAVQAVYRKAHFSGGGSSDDSVIVH